MLWMLTGLLDEGMRYVVDGMDDMKEMSVLWMLTGLL